MKKVSIAVMCLCLVLVSSGFAEAYSMSGRENKGERGDKQDKCYQEVMFILKNSDELGLSDQQKTDIMEQKYAMQKNQINKKAEIDLVAVDLKKELWKEDVDVNAVNALIDQKYQLKAQRQKDIIGTSVAIKNSLTAEQREKVKEMKQEMRRGRCGKMDMCNEKKVMGKK